MNQQSLYGSSLALLTDQYELTMAYGYWKLGMAERPAVFTHFYRTQPFGGGFAIAAGLETAIDYLQNLRFDASDLAYLATLKDAADKPLFEPAFLDYLDGVHFSCDIDALPEGTAVFPFEPLMRVSGPILQAQLIETAMLNLINFQTLIATKAARVCEAAQGDLVIEFGLRRAHGIDGGLSATRAAFVGGCQASSNVLAGKHFGIPPKGTHAHSWIMAFDTESEAFEAWAEVMPDNSVLLVDTYHSLEGVRHACHVGQEMQRRGKRLMGVRLDSGDLERLAKEARAILDEAGLLDAQIVASNELDEYTIHELKKKKSPISVWGVGTRLVTGHGKGALGGVYKLSAIADEEGRWKWKLKRSGGGKKVTIPGLLQVRRIRDSEGISIRDVIYEDEIGIEEEGEDLLVPILRKGRLVAKLPSLQEIQERTRAQVDALPRAIRRLEDPEEYPVLLEPRIKKVQEEMLSKI